MCRPGSALRKVGIGVLPVRKVSECPSSDGVYWLHWWKVELADENAVLILDPREVSEARWIRPVELRTLDDVFEADVRFFEEIYSALGRVCSLCQTRSAASVMGRDRGAPFPGIHWFPGSDGILRRGGCGENGFSIERESGRPASASARSAINGMQLPGVRHEAHRE